MPGTLPGRRARRADWAGEQDDDGGSRRRRPRAARRRREPAGAGPCHRLPRPAAARDGAAGGDRRIGGGHRAGSRALGPGPALAPEPRHGQRRARAVSRGGRVRAALLPFRAARRAAGHAAAGHARRGGCRRAGAACRSPAPTSHGPPARRAPAPAQLPAADELAAQRRGDLARPGVAGGERVRGPGPAGGAADARRGGRHRLHHPGAGHRFLRPAAPGPAVVVRR